MGEVVRWGRRKGSILFLLLFQCLTITIEAKQYLNGEADESEDEKVFRVGILNSVRGGR